MGDESTTTGASGPLPITPRDEVLAENQLLLRKLLLAAPEVQQRFSALHEQSCVVHQFTGLPNPHHGLSYWTAVGQLSQDLDGTWSEAEVDALAREWPTHAVRIAEGWPRIGFAYMTGRPGRKRGRSAPIIDLVAQSLALRAGGMGVSEADEAVADAQRTPASTITVYRQRLREQRAG